MSLVSLDEVSSAKLVEELEHRHRLRVFQLKCPYCGKALLSPTGGVIERPEDETLDCSCRFGRLDEYHPLNVLEPLRILDLTDALRDLRAARLQANLDAVEAAIRIGLEGFIDQPVTQEMRQLAAETISSSLNTRTADAISVTCHPGTLKDQISATISIPSPPFVIDEGGNVTYLPAIDKVPAAT